MRVVSGRVSGLERGVGEIRDEPTVNIAMLMRNAAEPIAGAALQSQITRVRDRLDMVEERVGRVESRLTAD